MSDTSLAAVLLLAAAVLMGVAALGPRNAAAEDLIGARRLGFRSRFRTLTRSLDNSESVLRISRLIEKSGHQLRAVEWLAMVLAGTAVLAVPVYLLRGPISGVLVAISIVGLAWMALINAVAKRQREFEAQIPELLQYLITTLRSGMSLSQAINHVALEMPAPAGVEMRRVAVEHRIGRTLTDALSDLAQRMGSEDFEWAVRAIDINRRTGGDLTVILRRLHGTIRSRNHVRGHVRTLTAEGRISALVLTVLPPALLVGLSLINPGFLDPLFTTLYGNAILLTSTIMILIGSIWLFRLARFRY